MSRKDLKALQKGNSQSSTDDRPKPWGEGELYRPLWVNPSSIRGQGTVEVEMIPYYAWANRGLAYMDVWIPLAR